jgi:hypothetical protein
VLIHATSTYAKSTVDNKKGKLSKLVGKYIYLNIMFIGTSEITQKPELSNSLIPQVKPPLK